MPMRISPKKFRDELLGIYALVGGESFMAKDLPKTNDIGASLKRLSSNGFIKKTGRSQKHRCIWKLNPDVVYKIERGDL